MSLDKQIIADLRQLVQAGPESARAIAWDEDSQRLLFATPQSHAILEFADHDRYSVMLRTLEVQRPTVSPAHPQAPLSTMAADVALHLSYLEEPLAVWELDAAEGKAQLRSQPPLREGDAVQYWEVTLEAATATATLARYRWAPGCVERELVEYPATFGLVARVAETLSESLGCV